MKAFATSIRASAALGMAQAAKRISGMAARLDRSSAVPEGNYVIDEAKNGTFKLKIVETERVKVTSIPPPPGKYISFYLEILYPPLQSFF